MIETTSIIWAITATVGLVAVYVLMRREVAKWRKFVLAADRKITAQQGLITKYCLGQMVAEGALLRYKRAASARGKHARAVQLERQNAAKAARTEKLRQELQASVALDKAA